MRLELYVVFAWLWWIGSVVWVQADAGEICCTYEQSQARLKSYLTTIDGGTR